MKHATIATIAGTMSEAALASIQADFVTFYAKHYTKSVPWRHTWMQFWCHHAATFSQRTQKPITMRQLGSIIDRAARETQAELR
jgi:hypothetical protein